MSEAPAMKITILTIFPEMFESVLNSSILGRARAQGILDIRCVDIRPFSDRKHKNTDDYPFGGGAGMVMLAQPILDAMRSVTGNDFQGRRIYLGPRGRTLSTAVARELAQEKELVLLCGHYEGVDQRALDTCIDEEISIGDYILTGGELAAMVLTDCVARFIPGVLGSAESPEEESFSDGLLEYPQYTRPRELNGMEVPDVLLSGDHAKIKAWRRIESLRATKKHRRTDQQGKASAGGIVMFLRKLLVIVVPLVLCGLCVFFLPLLGGFGLWSDLLQGLILGALLALLLPLSGASRRKEPFATLLVVPMIVLIVLLALQLMRALGVALPFQPVSGCTMMIECTFLSFMTVQAIRTKT